MTVPYIGADELASLLSMSAAIDALERVFADGTSSPPRQHLAVPGGELLLMPSSSAQGTGVKLVTVAPGNVERNLPLIHGVYVLFRPETLEPVALFDGAGLTRLRTAAVSGLATRHLARADATRLVVFGTGVQGKAHAEAMNAVRPITDIVWIDRDSGDPTAVAQADIVCTCTTSPTPVFQGALLAPGTHVNAIGAYKPTARELDDVAISAGRLVVEDRRAAFKEAGDLAIPLAAGVISEEDVEELKDVVVGAGRDSEEEITVFKSVGVAFEDLAVAAAAFAARTGR